MSARCTTRALLIAALIVVRPHIELAAQDSSARRRASAQTLAGRQLPVVDPRRSMVRASDTLRNVPPVVGQPTAIAQQLIMRSLLRPRVVAAGPTARASLGRVLSQTPAPGTTVRVGTTVTIIVGTRVDTTPGADTTSPGDDVGATIVPDVIGSPALVALVTLKRASLTGYFAAPVPTDVERAKVVKQSPAANRPVVIGTRVALTIVADTMTTVPTVVGLNGAQVRRAMGEATLRFVEQHAPDANVTAGLVAIQQPTGGTMVPLKSTVVVTYSDGPPPVVVPNLLGHTREEAERLIRAASLQTGRVDTVNSKEGFGRVVWQEPPAGKSVPPKTIVRLEIGRRDPDKPVTVPRLLGLTLDRATFALRRARLALHFVDSLPDSATAATIIRQNPPGGSTAAPGSDVHVWTAYPLPPPKPDSVVVPDVQNLTRDEAARRLEGARLNVGRELAAQTGSPGRVSLQDPEAGSRDTVGALVTLWIAPQRAVDSTTVPAVTELLADSALDLLGAARLRGRLTDNRAAREPVHWVVESQAPAAGTRVPVRSSVRLVVQHLPDSVVVPEVTTRRATDARVALGSGGLVMVVVNRRFALHLHETVVSQTPAGGERVLRGANVNVDLSRSLAWPLAIATVPLLGLATLAIRKPPRVPERPSSDPQPPVSFDVRGNETRTSPPTIDRAPNADVVAFAVTLEFALEKQDSFVEAADGPITLDQDSAHA
jgi:beta-lactam-binding protein with PASTA domain